MLEAQALSEKYQHFSTTCKIFLAPEHKRILNSFVVVGHKRLDFSRGFLLMNIQQPNMMQQNYMHHFTQNQLYLLMISYNCLKKSRKLVKFQYYRLDIPLCHFCNVLKMLNNSYQQTRHLELKRTVQILS